MFFQPHIFNIFIGFLMAGLAKFTIYKNFKYKIKLTKEIPKFGQHCIVSNKAKPPANRTKQQ